MMKYDGFKKFEDWTIRSQVILWDKRFNDYPKGVGLQAIGNPK